MEDFHFIRPLWLLAIVFLFLALYLLKRYRVSQSGWSNLLPPHLAKVLVTEGQATKPMSLTLPAFIGLLAVIAMAGPTWKKLPQPVYQVAKGSVLVMDMSYSMYATDLTPNRLTRSRYKAIDLLSQVKEGEMGLVAYAGDAFTISPLTDDMSNIELLLPSLSPDLMPELGSNPLVALMKASETLKNAGHLEGDIFWFTDGIEQEDVQDIVDWLRESPYYLHILGVGTPNGAPIKLNNGQLLKDNSGKIIVPKLTEGLLEVVANQGQSQYIRISSSNNDIEALLKPRVISEDEKQKGESQQTGDQWQDFGPYLLLLALPLTLIYFRRGILLSAAPVIAVGLLGLTPTPSHADFWSNLWKTKDQQGQELYNKEKYQQAADTFNNPLWQGSSHYKAGDFEKAYQSFKQDESANGFYNQGNALAKLQQLDLAIAAYEQALSLDPNHQDAMANKELLEKLRDQQQQNQQDGDSSNEQQENDQQQEQDGDQQQSDEEQSDQQQSEQEQQQNSENQDGQQQDQQNQQDAQNQDKQEQEKTDEQKAQEQQEQLAQEQKEQEEQQAKLQEAQEKEANQKHQQLLNKVTDDPYLLLRNKMQLEYQKRRQGSSSKGGNKKW